MAGSVRGGTHRINGPILMPPMSGIDHSDIDGRLLQVLLAVTEERSVTRAAARLDVTQSAVSHQLDRLRAITGDPLFVKSGRGIVPTARAEALAVQARRLLDELRAFAQGGSFDPAGFEGTVTIAANDLQRDLLLPLLLRHARIRAPRLALRIVPSGVPGAEMLRDGDCELVITPRPPEAADLVQRRLFDDRYLVYFDAASARRRATWTTTWPAEHLQRAPRNPAHAGHRRVDRRAACAAASPSPWRASPASRPSCAAARAWPRCPGCCAPACCAASRSRRHPSTARRCRCTWSGTSATRPMRCTSGCATSC